nr:energy-coupling factor ABC transporter ATP-binding protein [Bifidobacterium lemurum]
MPKSCDHSGSPMPQDAGVSMQGAGEGSVICAADHASFRYAAAGDDYALRDATLAIRQGECVVLCGQSGCGKTTLTRLFNGLVPSFFAGELTGSQRTCGLDAASTPIDVFTPLVGSVFQNPKTQYFNANTTDELTFACENMGLPSEEIRRRVESVARRFDVTHLLDRSVFHLSGGQKQRIAIAAATVLDPKVVVLDEPTSNLDASAIDDMRHAIERMKTDGLTVIVAEHRLAWLTGVADRYVVFEHGHVTHDLPASEFLALPQERIRALGLRALDLTPYRRRIERKLHNDDLAAPADRSSVDAASARERSRPKRGETILRTENLCVGYRKRDAFSRAIPDLELRSGEITGLMGRNGCGKTTLVRTLTGLIKPLSGRISLDGRPARPATLTRAGFLVMQDVNYQLFSDSVREELLLGLDETDPQVAARCERLLRELDLAELADRHPMSLSGGQKQRTAIASAMMCGKRLVVLDEPTSGLDRLHMEQVGALLRRLADTGTAVLVVTHDEELAADWCDRIIDLESTTPSSKEES